MDTLDLSGIAPVDTIQHEILKPGGIEGTGWVWDILGPSHPKAIAYNEDQQRKNLRRERQMEQQRQNGKKVVVEERTVEDQKRDMALWLASRVGGWNRSIKLIEVDPEPMAYSDDNVVKILINPKMGWIFNQIVDVITADSSFTKTSVVA